jgi:hypothetical protein
MSRLKACILLTIAMPQLVFCFNEKEYVGATQGTSKEMQPAPQKIKMQDYNSRLEIGGNYGYVTFKPHDHQTFHGNLSGMQAMYEYRPMNRFYGGGKFTWRQGDMDGDVGERSLLYFDAQERLGYTYSPEKGDWLMTLFSGFGYRYHGQKFHPNEGSAIEFKYNDIYIPVGILTNYDFSRCFSIGLNYIWMPQVYPTVSIVPLKGTRWILKKTVSNFYAELPLTFSFCQDKKYALIINPFYEHWQDGQTTAKLSNGTPLGLPGNTYNFYGVELNFAFDF